jgi:hypothetical protein
MIFTASNFCNANSQQGKKNGHGSSEVSQWYSELQTHTVTAATGLREIMAETYAQLDVIVYTCGRREAVLDDTTRRVRQDRFHREAHRLR